MYDRQKYCNSALVRLGDLLIIDNTPVYVLHIENNEAICSKGPDTSQKTLAILEALKTVSVFPKFPCLSQGTWWMVVSSH